MSEREEWRAFSGQLDDALALAPEARAAWLAELARAAPANAQRIRALLDSSPALAAAGFLEQSPLGGEVPPSLVGARVGPWLIEAEIGRGGMSSVWRARRDDGHVEAQAALKFVSFAALGQDGEARFRREGTLLGRLDHANIARLFDAGVYGPTHQPYLVLEYVDGVAIDDYATRERLGLRERIALFRCVLDAVAHAHGHLVVHRDLKPSNILVTRTGAVKLLDFGIAKLLESDERLTRTGISALTPQYAAPEQVTGEPITTRTDVYALGLLLYRLLTGSDACALESGSHADLQRAVVEATPPFPSEIAPGLPTVRDALRGDLDNIVMKALRKAPEERYATVAAFDEDLARFLRDEPVSARPATLPYRVSKFVRRNRGGVASAALITLALIATTAFALAQMLEARRQRDAAERAAERASAQAEFSDQVLRQFADAGERMTHELLLERSVAYVEKRYAEQPGLAVGFLIHLSGRYMNRGDTAAEYATLLKAERLAVRAQDALLLAQVECNTVETELALGRRDRARERLARGLAALARVENAGARNAFECSNAEVGMLEADGDLPGAIGAARRGARALEAADETPSIVYVSATSRLGVLLLHARHFEEALYWNDRGIEALERAGLEKSESMYALRMNRSQILAGGGLWAEACALARESVSRANGGLSEVALDVRDARVLGRCLTEIGESEAARAQLERAVSLATAQGNDLLAVQSQLAEADLALATRDLLRAHEALDSAHAQIARDPALYAESALQEQIARAALALAEGDAATAERESLAVLSGALQAGKPRALRIASAAALARGDLAAARQRAEEALRSAREVAIDEERSADVGEAQLALARVQLAAGERGPARSSAVRAASALRAGRGAAHASTREAEALAKPSSR